jgi:hypothetical protein
MAGYGAMHSPGRLSTAARIVWAAGRPLASEADVLCGSVLHLDASVHRGVVSAVQAAAMAAVRQETPSLR